MMSSMTRSNIPMGTWRDESRWSLSSLGRSFPNPSHRRAKARMVRTSGTLAPTSKRHSLSIFGQAGHLVIVPTQKVPDGITHRTPAQNRAEMIRASCQASVLLRGVRSSMRRGES